MPITNYQLPTTNYQLPTTHYPFPIPHSLFHTGLSTDDRSKKIKSQAGRKGISFFLH
ncbi:MAG: hypothetical protein AAF630_13600 [Cyanobacteria bacterium P01_C01_bin.38]